MLNSVSDAPAPVRRRLSAADRRRQLVAIGLAKIVETPIQDLSLDEVAAEAGISRGLLFHYFPTKTDFYLACIAAAGRRMLRTTAPDEDLSPEEQAQYAGPDAGFIAQNVYLFCASEGLGTVVRGLIDRAALAAAMGLAPHQQIVLAQSVGYPRAP